uniref:High-affinity zinc uptake system protein ZnuA n=1 Tax=Candidatus Kentrum sp. SD TaxID=2126332 RepID=A0A451BR22_9GAMM|nr:MAG: zinc transport system substrate-binding protein [Candidatus Kentron sp. SD]
MNLEIPSRNIIGIRNLLLATVLLLSWPLAPRVLAETPRELSRKSLQVVASILPIHSLVAGVMQGIGHPSLIVTGYGSPHTYRMRPSKARRLHNADLVFWVGDTLESFLRRPLASLPKTTQVIPLLKTPGLTLLANRKGGPWKTNTREIHASSAPPSKADTHALAYNPHIWLDPENVRKLVRAIASHLRQIDSGHGARYQANADRLSRRVRALEKTLEKRLAPFRDMPYLVFHDAFPYLERRYGLRAAGAVTANPNHIPGARRVADLRAAMKRQGIRCIFREPQFSAKLIETALEGANTRIGVLDPLGVHLQPGPDHWFQMMTDLARVITDCLSPKHQP